MSTEKTHARNRHAAPIGLVFILLCLIGLATVFKWCYNLTRDLADNTAQKTKFEQMLLPVVMFDPPDFSDPTTCDNEFLLQSSLWACMLGERRGSYEHDEYGRLIIPAAAVDAQAASLFGPGVKLEHKTIGDMENAYQYDSEITSYHVPIIAMTGFATPRVEKISAKQESCELTVGYVPPTTVLSINYDSKGNLEESPSKYMLYELRKNGKEFYLYAVSTITSSNLPGTEFNAGGKVDGLLPADNQLQAGSPIESP